MDETTAAGPSTKSPAENLDEAVTHLQRIVDLAQVSNNLQSGMLAALTGSDVKPASGAAVVKPPDAADAPGGKKSGGLGGDGDGRNPVELLAQLVEQGRQANYTLAGMYVVLLNDRGQKAGKGEEQPPADGNDGVGRDTKAGRFVDTVTKYRQQFFKMKDKGAKIGREGGNFLGKTGGKIAGKFAEVSGRALSRAGKAIGNNKAGRLLGQTGNLLAKGGSTAEAGGAAAGAEAGAAAGGALGAAAGIFGAVAAVVVAIKSAVDTVAKYTDAQLDAARKFENVSGSMAGVFAEKDTRDLIRNMDIAEQTAGSTRRLAESSGNRQDASAKLEIAATNAVNNLLAGLNDAITPFLNGLNVILEGAKEIPVIGEKIKKLTEGDVAGAALLVEEANRFMTMSDQLDEKAKNMMIAARGAGIGGPTGVAPKGAGAVPFGVLKIK